MPTEQEFQELLARVEKLEQAPSLKLPLDVPTKSALENAQFLILQATVFKGGLPVYTTARDVTVDPPKHGEIWLEDVSGPTRRICAFIVEPTTGVGTKYSVAIT